MSQKSESQKEQHPDRSIERFHSPLEDVVGCKLAEFIWRNVMELVVCGCVSMLLTVSDSPVTGVGCS